MDTPTPDANGMITPVPGSFGSLGAVTGTTGGSYPAALNNDAAEAAYAYAAGGPGAATTNEQEA